MSLIILDGPNKAGKSVLATIIVSVALGRYHHTRSIEVRHWGPIKSTTEYMEPLVEDLMSEDIIIWDRCWVSEYVYGHMGVGRPDREFAINPAMGEWLFTNLIAPFSAKAILIGPESSSRGWHDRDKKDDAIDLIQYQKERMLYSEYANMFGWNAFYSNRDIYPTRATSRPMFHGCPVKSKYEIANTLLDRLEENEGLAAERGLVKGAIRCADTNITNKIILVDGNADWKHPTDQPPIGNKGQINKIFSRFTSFDAVRDILAIAARLPTWEKLFANYTTQEVLGTNNKAHMWLKHTVSHRKPLFISGKETNSFVENLKSIRK